MILGKDIIYKTLPRTLDIKETKKTLLENSLSKAECAFKISHTPCLTEDSGLFIYALDGKPGVHSARYGSSDKERIERVLSKMAGKKNRNAKFKAVYVYYYAPKKYRVFEGECRGMIALRPKGKSGFGYDPIFIPRGYKKTFAELGPRIKNRMSHRARALKKFKNYIRNLLKNDAKCIRMQS